MKPTASLLIALVLIALSATPAPAIVYGEPDGNDHPFVGVLVLRQADGHVSRWCSGTLIAERVFLTAAHCTFDLDEVLVATPGAQFLVTFDPIISETGTFFTGTWHTNPNYNDFQGQLGHSDPGDVGVIVLDQAPGITPAQLPTAGCSTSCGPAIRSGIRAS
jgi:V8-like Glu-specific endopeptidase